MARFCSSKSPQCHDGRQVEMFSGSVRLVYVGCAVRMPRRRGSDKYERIGSLLTDVGERFLVAYQDLGQRPVVRAAVQHDHAGCRSRGIALKRRKMLAPRLLNVSRRPLRDDERQTNVRCNGCFTAKSRSLERLLIEHLRYDD